MLNDEATIVPTVLASTTGVEARRAFSSTLLTNLHTPLREKGGELSLGLAGAIRAHVAPKVIKIVC